MNRRRALASLAAWVAAGPAHALMDRGPDAATPVLLLDATQSRHFRAWMLTLIDAQLHMGPSPRWQHRDCAGLVRYTVRESLRRHDPVWVRANGLVGRRLPPELSLSETQRKLLSTWKNFDGRRLPYVSALALVQHNCRLLGRELVRAVPGDLLCFDQGEDQHLMVWMGNYVAYHTGTETPSDNGLRAVSVERLIQWEDTRWRPITENSNFVGVFRLAFLSR